MTRVKIHIWHDLSGKILAIGRPGVNSRHHAIPLSGEGQLVLETEIEEAKIKKLPHTHAIDVTKKTLVEFEPRTTEK